GTLNTRRVCLLLISEGHFKFWRTQFMLSRRTKLWLGLIVGISLLSLASSCKRTTEEEGPSTETGTPYKTTGKEGTIAGVVSYTGAAPEGKKIDTSADAACTAKSPDLKTEDWAVKDGKLANTYVYIKEGTTADGK